MEKKIRENVNNIEECLSALIDQNNLIDMLQTGYFGKNRYSFEEAWMLAHEYKRYQSLLSVISSQLNYIEKNLAENLNSLMESLNTTGYEK